MKSGAWQTSIISRSLASRRLTSAGTSAAISMGIFVTPCWSPRIRSPVFTVRPPTVTGTLASTRWTYACETRGWLAKARKFSARISSRSRTPPSVTVPTHPSALWTLLWTSPQKEPTGLGASRSCRTITRGSGTFSTSSTQSRRDTCIRSVGARSARMTPVTAYPIIPPSSGNMHRTWGDMKPSFRGRTSNVSIAFATAHDCSCPSSSSNSLVNSAIVPSHIV